MTAQIGEIAMTRIRQMVLARRKERGEDTEAGFTLIELLVVLLIIAILLAIAIPTFLGARTSAENRAAQTTLRNALTEAQAAYTGGAKYPSSLPTGQGYHLTSSSASSSPNTVSYIVGAKGQSVVLAAYAKSGNCYYIADVMSSSSTSISSVTGTGTAAGSTAAAPNTYYGEGAPTSGACTAADAPSLAKGWAASTSVGW